MLIMKNDVLVTEENNKFMHLQIVVTRVSAAADRPMRQRGSVHAKYSVSHHMVIKLFLLLGLAAEYRSRW